jgi:3'(2'), 5'-bisphosphate nucleotidase
MSLTRARLEELLTPVVAIARAAGEEIMRVYRSEFAVSHKQDRSPLTEADLAAERRIAAGLAALTPAIPMLGEESVATTESLRRGWQRLWLVDPLDGTREFVKRNGEFTVNIALIEDHVPVLGVIYAPARELLYTAARGCGAKRVGADGAATPIHARVPAPAVPRVAGSRSHRGGGLARALERLGPHELVSIGSALKFGMLAEGAVDLYLRDGPTSEWDTAAGQAIATEAGARVVDLAGRPLRYNARDTLINPSFAAWADDTRDWLAITRGL